MLRRLWNAGLTIITGVVVAASGFWLISDPDTPLPPEWNPIAPLDLGEPVSIWTGMKLRRAVADEGLCLAALDGFAAFQSMTPLVADGGCGIDPRVSLSGVGEATFPPLETTCAVALRLALWERHVVQPQAMDSFGERVTALRHQSSYNCRPIRGDSTRLSTHATAEAIDIEGVTLASGRQIELLGNWQGDSPEARFFRDLHAGACRWFVTVLGPDFNALHADHFHMQSVGRGSCR